MGNCEIAKSSKEGEIIQGELSSHLLTMHMKELRIVAERLFQRKIQLISQLNLVKEYPFASEKEKTILDDEESAILISINNIDSCLENLEKLLLNAVSTNETQDEGFSFAQSDSLLHQSNILLMKRMASEKY